MPILKKWIILILISIYTQFAFGLLTLENIFIPSPTKTKSSVDQFRMQANQDLFLYLHTFNANHSATLNLYSLQSDGIKMEADLLYLLTPAEKSNCSNLNFSLGEKEVLLTCQKSLESSVAFYFFFKDGSFWQREFFSETLSKQSILTISYLKQNWAIATKEQVYLWNPNQSLKRITNFTSQQSIKNLTWINSDYLAITLEGDQNYLLSLNILNGKIQNALGTIKLALGSEIFELKSNGNRLLFLRKTGKQVYIEIYQWIKNELQFQESILIIDEISYERTLKAEWISEKSFVVSRPYNNLTPQLRSSGVIDVYQLQNRSFQKIESLDAGENSQQALLFGLDLAVTEKNLFVATGYGMNPSLPTTQRRQIYQFRKSE